MNLKFLIVLTMVLSAFLVLPVNANTIYDNIPVYVININTGNYNIIVHNSDSVYLIGAWGATLPQQEAVLATYKNTYINGYNIASDSNHVYTGHSANTNSLPLIDVLNAGVNPYVIHNPNHYGTVTYSAVIGKGVSGSQSVTGTITFTYDNNYESKTNTAYIQTSVDHYTEDTITYNVQCKSEYPNDIYYSSIGNYRDFSLGLIQFDENETATQITTGMNGTNIYAWCMDKNNGNSRLLQTYLESRSEADIPIEPTIEPTATPTTQPEYSDKIPFEIECIDYDKGIQLIGTNITVYYYTESNNALDRFYHDGNSNGLTRLAVKNNSVLFIEYNLNGYNAVNIDTFEYLDNKQGKLTDSNLGSARLYFSKIDPSVLLFQGFIIKDSLGRALSGVSVTIDNNQTIISNEYGGVRFDNINQGSHTFTFIKNGYYSQALTKTVSVSNTQDIMLQSTTAPTIAPTTAPTIAPTPIQTDSQGNIIIGKPNNIADSIKYGLAKIFGVYDINALNLVFALLLILFPAVIGGSITGQALGFISGGLIGFVFALALGLIPIWVFFAMIMTAVIYLVLTKGQEGF